MSNNDDFDYDAWRDQVRQDAQRWRHIRQQFETRRRLTRELKTVATSQKHPKWDERYVELLLLISEGDEQSETPPVARQLTDRMDIELAADRGRLMNLMRAGYLGRFKHERQAGQLYYFLTEAGRQFLTDVLGPS
jgi:hypothetical protein